jgi:hypothetical protein
MLLVSRKICAIALALTTAGSVAGCSPGSSSPAPATTASAPVTTNAATPQTSDIESPDGSEMEYREAYHGQNFVVTTNRGSSGWTYRVEFTGGDNRSPLMSAEGSRYSTSEEARSAALSAAAAAIDSGRTGTGKP